MPEPDVRKFRIMRIRHPPVQIEARNFRDFIEKSRCRSRTETVRELRKGNSFYIEAGKKPGYDSDSMQFTSINVALEAFRNMSETGEGSCELHVLTHDNAQMSYLSLPKKDGMDSIRVRKEFAKHLSDLVSEGTILVVSGNKAHADSEELKKE